jgi:hypothetical protein
LSSDDLLIALAPQIKNLAGHHVIYHTCLQQAVQEAGAACRVILRADCDVPTLPTGWEKSIDTQAETNPYCTLLQNRPPHVKRRFFLLDSFCTEDLLDFSQAFSSTAHPDDYAWLFLRYDFEHFALCGMLHTDLLRGLLQQFGSRILFLTDTTLIQRDAEKQLGAKVALLPIPHTFTHNSTPEQERLIFWWPGYPRKDKGLHILQQIVQFPCPREKLLLRLGFSPQIDPRTARVPTEFLPPILAREDYCKAMESAHILLLPYEQERYALSSSGIFIEGVVAGKMPAVTGKTWLSHELQRYSLDDLVMDWEDPHLWQRLADLFSGYCAIINSSS